MSIKKSRGRPSPNRELIESIKDVVKASANKIVNKALKEEGNAEEYTRKTI